MHQCHNLSLTGDAAFTYLQVGSAPPKQNCWGNCRTFHTDWMLFLSSPNQHCQSTQVSIIWKIIRFSTSVLCYLCGPLCFLCFFNFLESLACPCPCPLLNSFAFFFFFFCLAASSSSFWWVFSNVRFFSSELQTDKYPALNIYQIYDTEIGNSKFFHVNLSTAFWRTHHVSFGLFCFLLD